MSESKLYFNQLLNKAHGKITANPIITLGLFSTLFLIYRIFLASRVELHADEAINLLHSQQSWTELFFQPNRDHPQILYFILKSVQTLSGLSSELALRTHNLIFGFFLPFIFYRFFISLKLSVGIATLLSIFSCLHPELVKMQVFGMNYPLLILFLLMSFTSLNNGYSKTNYSLFFRGLFFYIFAFFTHYSAVLYGPLFLYLSVPYLRQFDKKNWLILGSISGIILALWTPQMAIMFEYLDIKFFQLETQKWWDFLLRANQKMSPQYFSNHQALFAHLALFCAFICCGRNRAVVFLGFLAPLFLLGLFSTNHFLAARYVPLQATFLLLMLAQFGESKQLKAGLGIFLASYFVLIFPMWKKHNLHIAPPFRSFAKKIRPLVDKNTVFVTVSYHEEAFRYYFDNPKTKILKQFTMSDLETKKNVIVILPGHAIRGGKVQPYFLNNFPIGNEIKKMNWEIFGKDYPNYLKFYYMILGSQHG